METLVMRKLFLELEYSHPKSCGLSHGWNKVSHWIKSRLQNSKQNGQSGKLWKHAVITSRAAWLQKKIENLVLF